jgi:hypothetical protein
MKSRFSLFQSHLDLAHSYWARLLQPGDYAMDATCGNGHDTLKLAQLLNGTGRVWGIDLQKEAIDNTRALLKAQLTDAALNSVSLFEQSHATFPESVSRYPLRLVIYNLGYLPKGDKTVTTMTAITLQSVRLAMDLLLPGGAVSITCYPGHPEGACEDLALQELCRSLSPALWSVCMHTFTNRVASPRLLLIQKADPAPQM